MAVLNRTRDRRVAARDVSGEGWGLRASLLEGPGIIAVREAPDAELGAGEVLLRVRQAAICGSDRKSVAQGALTRGRVALPGAPGHECVGEVLESDNAAFRPGQMVLAMAPLDNAFAERLVVDPQRCVLLPPEMEPSIAILGQQLGTVLHALRAVGSLLDRTVAIVGQGPGGLLFQHLAWSMGARQVVCFERRAARRAAASALGADPVVDPADANAMAAAVARLNGGADLAIDAAGGQAGIDLSYQAVRAFGAVLQYGLPSGAVQMDHEVAFRKQATTYRSVHAQAEPDLACFKLAVRTLARGSVPLDVLVSHHVPLERLSDAIALANDRAGNAVKVLIDL